jgi:polygalacturonase
LKNQVERRGFLKKAVQSALAAPMLALLPCLAETQESKKNASGADPGREPSRPAKPAVSLNVKDYGATGDGKTKDTVAIQQTIERCAVLGGGEVVVPARDYLTGALTLRSGVVLRVEEGATLNGSPDMEDYPLAQVRWEGHWIKGYSAFISAWDAEDTGIAGPGKIAGSPAMVGRLERPSGLRLPALLEFVNCRNVRVENCFTQNYGMWSIHPVYCESITFKNVVVKSGADGIDVDSCKHVTIDGCDFDTTDDCISLKSGRGIEGYTIARATEGVHISNCTFADKVWACIGIGWQRDLRRNPRHTCGPLPVRERGDVRHLHQKPAGTWRVYREYFHERSGGVGREEWVPAIQYSQQRHCRYAKPGAWR